MVQKSLTTSFKIPLSIFHLNRKTLKRARNMDSSRRTFWGVSTVTTRRGWTKNEMHLDTSKRAPKIPISHRLTISHVEPSSSGFFSHLNFEKTLRMRLNWGTRFFSHSFPRNHRQTTFCSCTLSCLKFEVWSFLKVHNNKSLMIANTGADDGHCCLLYTSIGLLYPIEAEIQMNIIVATNCFLIQIWI